MKRVLKYVTQKRSNKKAGGSVDSVPHARITNETVAEAREDVLSGARKLIYPLAHSKHRVIVVSTILIVTALIVFTTYMTLALYRFQNSSDFTYRVTQAIPFPIARVGSTLVPYEHYLFDLRRYVYYYNNVENIDFNNPVYAPQLDDQKKRILQKVVNMEYVRQIAAQKDIMVTNQEVDARISTLREQNRLGNNDRVFEDTLRDFYNWDEQDFRRSIRNDILVSKVLAVIDTDARSKVNAAMEELNKGAEFGAVVASFSEDELTKASAGEIAGWIDPKDRNVLSEQAAVLAGIQVGQYSEPINVGYGFEVIKKLEEKDGRYRAAHIVVRFKSLDDALNETKSKRKATVYVRL